jgi:hypothetical protein
MVAIRPPLVHTDLATLWLEHAVGAKRRGDRKLRPAIHNAAPVPWATVTLEQKPIELAHTDSSSAADSSRQLGVLPYGAIVIAWLSVAITK